MPMPMPISKQRRAQWKKIALERWNSTKQRCVRRDVDVQVAGKRQTPKVREVPNDRLVRVPSPIDKYTDSRSPYYFTLQDLSSESWRARLSPQGLEVVYIRSKPLQTGTEPGPASERCREGAMSTASKVTGANPISHFFHFCGGKGRQELAVDCGGPGI